MVIEEAPVDPGQTPRPTTPAAGPFLAALSAPGERDLERYAEKLLDFLEENPDFEDMARLAFTLQTGRATMKARLAVIASDAKELRRRLRACIDGEDDVEGVFRSSATGASGYALLLDGDEGRAYIEATLRNRNMEKAAALWTAGASIDWSRLYPEGPPGRIPLPPYPLDPVSYWVTPTRQPARGGEAKGMPLHPLVHRDASTVDERHFEAVFTGKDQFFQEHRVNGRMVLPGVAHLEMALAAGCAAMPERRIAGLKDVVWVRPIVVEDAPLRVFIRLRPRGGEVFFEIAPADDGNRAIYSQGRFILDEEAEAVPPIHSLEAVSVIASRCPEIVAESAFREKIRARGFDAGPLFDVVREARRGEGEALSLLAMPKVDDNSGKWRLHPSILNGAVETVVLLMREELDSRPGAFLPFELRELRLGGARERMPGKSWAHIRRVGKDGGGDGDSGGFDVDLLDDSGKILARLNGFRLRRRRPGANPVASLSNAPSSDALSEDAPKLLLFEPVWTEAPLGAGLTTHGGSRFEDKGPLLILGDGATADALARRASDRGVRCARAFYAEDFSIIGSDRFHLNPGSEEDFTRLFQALAEMDMFPASIVSLQSEAIARKEHPDGPPAFDLGSWLPAVFHLTKVVASASTALGREVNILHAWVGSAEEHAPMAAGIGAFFRAVRHESPRTRCKVVRIEERPHGEPNRSAETAEILEAELHLPFDHVEAVHHGGIRSVRVLKERGAFSGGGGLRIREGSVALVTGGAGGLGRIIARMLAANGATVIAAGRSKSPVDLPPETAQGPSTIEYIRADVGSRDDVSRLLREIKARHGRLDAIVHAAGVLRDGRLKEKGLGEALSVIAPKARGAVILDELTAEEDLELFIMFSSLAAVVGNPGQTDYACANGFLDGFAEWREALRAKGKRSGRTISIDWPLWKEGGMQVHPVAAAMLYRWLGMRPMATSDGLKALSEAIAAPASRIVAVAGDAGKIRAALTGGKSSGAPKTFRPHRDEARAYQKLRMDVRDMIAAILRFDVEDIDLGEEMRRFGFDSISFTRLANAISDAYDVTVLPSVFFEHDSPESLCRWIFETHKEAVCSRCSKREATPEDAAEALGEAPSRPAALSRERRSAAPRLDARGEPVAVVGMSGVFPGSPNLETFFRHLDRGEDLIGEIPPDRWDWRKFTGAPHGSALKWGGFIDRVDAFDAAFFGISRREAELMDPQQRLFLQAAWSAIEDAGHRPEELSGTRTGLFVGIANMEYLDLLKTHGVEADPYLSTGAFHSMAANRISHLLDLAGPSEPIDTACSSSLVAIHKAVRALRGGECDAAIAGGVNVILQPYLHAAAAKAGLLSPGGRCRAFDKDADGYVRGEGVGAVFLKSLKQAEADGDFIYAVIRESAVNHGGRSASLTAPNPRRQADLLVEAYGRAGIDPATITCVETHGTGTRLGDPIEINGLKQAFAELYKRWGKDAPRRPHCALGSVKANIGHLETAAGVASVIKTILAMRHGILPGNIHLSEQNPLIDLEGTPFYLLRETREWKRVADGEGAEAPRRAGVSSFGFGGVNAHIILEEYGSPCPRGNGADDETHIFPLSAATPERLHDYARSLAEWLESRTYRGKGIGNFPLSQIAYTLQAGRPEMGERLAVAAHSGEALLSGLKSFLADRKDGSVFSGRRVKRDDMRPRPRVAADETHPSTVAERWVRGEEIDFQELHPPGRGQRVPLPTYPFAMERYWVPNVAAESIESGPRKKNTGNAASAVEHKRRGQPEVCVSARLDARAPLIRDHRVHGRVIVAGAACLELVLKAAARNGLSALPIRIGDASWARPLEVTGGQVDAELVFRPATRNGEELEFEIRTGSPQAVHMRGEVGPIHENGAAAHKQDISSIKARMSGHIAGPSLYERFEGLGLSYGPEYKALDAVWFNGDEALARITSRAASTELAPPALPEALPDSGSDFPGLDPFSHWSKCTLHPGILDAALQTVAVLGGNESRLIAPFALRRIDVLRPLEPSSYAHVRRSGNDLFSITILDAEGNPCAEIVDLSARCYLPPMELAYYAPKWLRIQNRPKEDEKKRKEPVAPSSRKTVLLVAPAAGAEIVETLRTRHKGDRFVEITPGSHGERTGGAQWTADESSVESFRAAIMEIGFPDIVYFMGSDCESPGPLATLEDIKQRQQDGVVSLLHLARALDSAEDPHTRENPLQLTILTGNGFSLDRLEPVNPCGAALHGFALSMMREYPQWRIACIDLDANGPFHADRETPNRLCKDAKPDELVAQIDRIAMKGGLFMIRNGEVYDRRIVPVRDLGMARPPLRRRGVHLIVGGAGGLGFETARFLAAKYNSRLVLAGRRPFDEPLKAKIAALEALGGEVEYIRADVTEPDDVRRLLHGALERFGEINGVIHSALALKDSVIAGMAGASLIEVMAPKVEGGLLLARGLAKIPLDFLVFYSSTQSFLGNAGQANYTAASAFVDALSFQMQGIVSYPVKVINWGYWGSVGVVRGQDYARRMAGMGVGSIEPEEGMEAFERILASPFEQVIAVKADDAFMQKIGRNNDFRIVFHTEHAPSMLN